MEKKIFESKGIPKKQTLLFLICGIFAAAAGIFFIVLSNVKRSGISISSSFGSGTIGGGYMLSENARKTLMIVGIVVIILGATLLGNLLTMKKSMFAVYEKHIEGIQYIPLFIINIKRAFHLEYGQIKDVQISQGNFGPVLKIVTEGENYGVILKADSKEAIEYIRQKLKNTI